MKILALLLFVVLALIAAMHAYWAFGGLWPASSEQELVNTIIGAADMTGMPSTGSTLVVAGLIFVTGTIGLAVGGIVNPAPRWLLRVLAAGTGLVFLARGVAGYFFEAVAWTPVEPFATLNRVIYSPLCLAIAIAFFLLALSRGNSNKGFNI